MATSGQSRDLSPAAEAFAQFLSACGRGDEPDLEQWCAERPDVAPKLRRLAARWRELEAALGADRTALESSLDGAAGSPSFSFVPGDGDRYEVGDEIAHGGMGVVYAVWDRQLRRKLAIKVLRGDESDADSRSTARTDPRSLSRFLDEAQIMAQLDHPGVVPVHEVGMDAEGRVYLAMSLVRGRSYKEIIDAVHAPGDDDAGAGPDRWTRTRALGVLSNVCDTVAFAHAKGVVHRDLKPSNVMVGRFGETYVMDWGLARTATREEKRDIRLQGVADSLSSVRSGRGDLADQEPDSPLITMDGDVVGTPAYMPPEQARGDVDQVGPRADVYSVGAMLYHLIAGHMPYVPKDTRVSPRTVLAQVLHGKPTPLHQVAPHAPSELVAVCEKAMAPDPANRYADMVELADDLRAFLELRVVRAWGGGTWAELGKWVRRNRALTVTAAAGVLALAVGLLIALIQKSRADDLATEAAAQTQLAVDNAENAERQFAIAFDAVERMLEHVGSRRLDNVPRAHPVRRELYEDALVYYEAFLAERGDDPAVRRKVARAHYLVAGVRRKLGDNEAAERDAWRAIAAFGALCAEDPNDTDLAIQHIDATVARGSNLSEMGHTDRGVELFERALALLRPLEPASSPELRIKVLYRRARIHGAIGVTCAFETRHEQARDHLQQSVAVARELVAVDDQERHLSLLAGHLDRLGFAILESLRSPGKRGLADHSEAEAVALDAVAIWTRLLEKSPDSEDVRAGHALAIMNLAVAQDGDPQADLKARQQAVELWSSLVADYSGVPDYRAQFATSLCNLAARIDDPDEALELFARSLKNLQRALELRPNHGHYNEMLMRVHRQRLMTLCDDQRHESIPQYSAELASADAKTADSPRAAAVYLAYAIKFAGSDPDLSDEERSKAVDAYARQAVEHLRTAAARGWRDIEYLERNHFKGLREHPDCQAFIEELRRAERDDQEP